MNDDYNPLEGIEGYEAQAVAEPEQAPAVGDDPAVLAAYERGRAEMAAMQLRELAPALHQPAYQPPVEQEPEFDYTDIEGSTRRLARKMAEEIIAERLGNMPDPSVIERTVQAKIEARNVVESYAGKLPPAVLAEAREKLGQMNQIDPEAVRLFLDAQAYRHQQSGGVSAVERSVPSYNVPDGDPYADALRSIPATRLEMIKSELRGAGEKVTPLRILQMEDVMNGRMPRSS